MEAYLDESFCQKYNPLYLLTEEGLDMDKFGQTVKSSIAEKYPNKKIIYVKGGDFVKEFVNAVKGRQIENLIHKYKNCDVLIIGGLEELNEKYKSQEELFHIFKHLTEKSKQVIFICNISPEKIEGLAERMVSHFMNNVIIIDNKFVERDVELARNILTPLVATKGYLELLNEGKIKKEEIKGTYKKLVAALDRVIPQLQKILRIKV